MKYFAKIFAKKLIQKSKHDFFVGKTKSTNQQHSS